MREPAEVRQGVGRAGLVLWRVLLGCFALVVFGVAFLSGHTHIQLITDFYADNSAWLMLLAGAGMLVACALLRRADTSDVEWFDHYFGLVVVLLSALLLTFEAQVARDCELYTTWDPNAFVDYLSGDVASTQGYFDANGNQVFLLWVFSGVKSLCGAIGFVNWHLGLSYGAALIACLCCALCAFVARRLAGSWTWGLFAWFVCAVLVGCSPWLLVPYSDSYGILSPTIVLFAYVCVRRPWLKGGIIGLFSVVGYLIKPTSLAMLAAIALVEAVRLARGAARRRRARREALCGDAGEGSARKGGARRVAAVVVACAVGVGCAVALNGLALGGAPRSDPERALSWQHYLMMGTNPKNGMYDADDSRFSASFATREERNAADLAEFRRRVAELGPAGLLRLWADKTIVNFNDGTFGWDREGNPPTQVVGKDSDLLRYYEVKPYGPQDGGAFRTVAQVAWYAVMLGMVAGLADRRPRRQLVAALMAVGMLALFLMVFECRARYLYLYLPYFIVLGVCGWKSFADRVARHMQAASQGR
ncbi:MAG: hypothetical protein LKG38_02585 [Atopobiaceae bacterium]|jgi:hypothetical protein|nr:hypothetical protein [Atopobiaceae bacterium]MCI1318212.1 hypothetical protein [Atopobiaceae bacterium]MCI1388683.1 hypothetical protein [Atopobiaceae bacterium]MCI1432697.1 hypothetical protein [Atopobiaceae bacterium]MCI1470966.1 hypothetical protein [Atopobiaceae bacterium]